MPTSVTVFLVYFGGSAHAIGEHRLGPLISGLLRTTTREKLTFRDEAAMRKIAEWLRRCRACANGVTATAKSQVGGRQGLRADDTRGA